MSLSGRADAGVVGLDLGVVPLLDLAQEDGRQGLPGEAQAGGGRHLGEVVRRHHRPQGGGDVVEGPALGLRQLLVGHRPVCGAEVHRLVGDGLDPAPGADGLVVDPHLGQAVVGVEPLGVEGRGEGGPGPGEVLRFAREGAADQPAAGDVQLRPGRPAGPRRRPCARRGLVRAAGGQGGGAHQRPRPHQPAPAAQLHGGVGHNRLSSQAPELAPLRLLARVSQPAISPRLRRD